MADIFIDIFNFIFTVILAGVFLTWIMLLNSMYKSFTKAPFLDKFENTSTTTPKVSVILPARNEENFISKCLETLGSQDYKDFEVIAIDDSSEDRTGEIIAKLTAAKELNNSEIEKIRNELTQNFGKNIKLDYKYDTSLIGGLTIQVGSVMVDTSIKNKLKQIENKMLEK